MANGETSSPLCLSDKVTPTVKQTPQLHPNDARGHQYHHHQQQHPSFVLSSPEGTSADDGIHDVNGGGGGDGGGGGPYQNDSGANEVKKSTSTRAAMTCTNTSVLYRDDVGVGAGAGAVSGGFATVVTTAPVRALQPFDISTTNSAAFKFPGGGMAAAAALGFPFTPAQWKELERQAMIYKYMIASVPVPPDLLFPIPSRNLPADPTVPWNDNGALVYNLRYSTASTNKDLEPGRCKRTDGKKWRCSRDVAPHQKYCERHMHRGRPRSRKPVELNSSVDTTATATATATNNNKKSRLQATPTPTNPPTTAIGDHQSKEALFLDSPSSGQQNIFSSSDNYKQPSRVFGWSMEDVVESVNGVEQQWLHLMDTKRGLGATNIFDANPCILQQGYGEEPLNLFSQSNGFAPGNIDNNNNRDQYRVFLNNYDIITSKHPRLEQHRNPTRGLIDAWSNGGPKTMEPSSTVACSKEILCPDALTLSMALDEGMELATPVSNPEHKAKCGAVSCLPFHSGGPLAEVLRSSNSIPIGSKPASPYTGNGDSISPPATTVSSPTGILHRALFSHSDSSVCNSPTVGTSAAAPPDLVAFQWLN